MTYFLFMCLPFLLADRPGIISLLRMLQLHQQASPNLHWVVQTNDDPTFESSKIT